MGALQPGCLLYVESDLEGPGGDSRTDKAAMATMSTRISELVETWGLMNIKEGGRERKEGRAQLSGKVFRGQVLSLPLVWSCCQGWHTVRREYD